MERDQITEYLGQLRSGLLTSRRRAQLILDEAEDHLRESAAAGLVGGALLGGLALIRYWQRRSGRVRPRLLGSYSPIPGAIVMFFLAALIVYAWKRSDAPAYGLPDVGVALIAAVCSAACYLVAWGRALRRRPRALVASA